MIILFFQTNEQIRVQSLKLLGSLAFNTSSLILSHLETIVKGLVSLTHEEEPQVAIHACRVLEIISRSLTNTKSIDASTKFWRLSFDPIISLLQHSQTSIRETACDCLGNIRSEMLAQLSVRYF